MDARTIRDIQFEKGEHFTSKYINDFEIEWNKTTEKIRKSGVNLSAIPIVKG